MKRMHYGWVMVILGACVFSMHAVVVFTFGIFLLPLATEFGWDRGAVSLAFSILCVTEGILIIFAGRISDKYGPRYLITANGVLIGIGFLLLPQVNSLWQVYLIWGLVLGIGVSCAIIPTTSTVSRWFTEKRGVAIGIVFAGMGVGAVLWPPITQWLISSYGWRQSYIILGLIYLIIVVILAQFMKHPHQMGLKPYGEGKTIEAKQAVAPATAGIFFKQAIRTGRFWIIGLLQFCIFFSLQVVIIHLPPFAIDSGISTLVAAGILSIVSVAGVISRLFIGFISEKIGSRLVLSACFIMAIIAFIGLLFVKETWMFYMFAVLFGVAQGGSIPLLTVVPSELFGLRSLGAILGSFWIFGLVGAAASPPIAGRIFDITGSYSLALLMSIVVCLLAIILSLILLRYKVKVE